MLHAEKLAMKTSSIAHRVFAHGGSRQEGSSDVPGGGTKKGAARVFTYGPGMVPSAAVYGHREYQVPASAVSCKP